MPRQSHPGMTPVYLMSLLALRPRTARGSKMPGGGLPPCSRPGRPGSIPAQGRGQSTAFYKISSEPTSWHFGVYPWINPQPLTVTRVGSQEILPHLSYSRARFRLNLLELPLFSSAELLDLPCLRVFGGVRVYGEKCGGPP